MKKLSTWGISALCLICLLPAGAPAMAQAYPTKPIEVLVGFAPGGGTDLTIRMLEGAVSKELGQKIIVTNKPGAGGTMVFNQFLNAAPDGYTLAMGTTAGLTIQPHVQPDQVMYKRDSYVPVIQLSNVPNLLIVPPDSPYKTLAELIDAARKSPPGQIKVAITTLGNTLHLPMVQLEKQYGVKFTYIPHKSSEPIVTAVMGGHVDAGVADLAAAGPKLTSNSVRSLGLFSANRLASLPSVPTMKEQGADVQASFYNLVVAPKGTPDAIVKRLHDAFHKAMLDPAVVERATSMNLPLDYLDGAQSRARLDRDYTTFGALLGDLGLKK